MAISIRLDVRTRHSTTLVALRHRRTASGLVLALQQALFSPLTWLSSRSRSRDRLPKHMDHYARRHRSAAHKDGRTAARQDRGNRMIGTHGTTHLASDLVPGTSTTICLPVALLQEDHQLISLDFLLLAEDLVIPADLVAYLCLPQAAIRLATIHRPDHLPIEIAATQDV